MAVAVAAAFSFGSVVAAQAASDIGTGGTSANWAGYAETGQTYDLVTATWEEPAMPVPCVFGSTGPSLASFRTGFDGYGNANAEQVGTLIECIPNAPPSGPNTPMVVKHAGFYQVGNAGLGTVFCNPEPPAVTRGCTGSFALKAGDKVTATASFADGTFTFELHNWRTDESVTATATSAGATRTSAETVVESPLGGNPPLTNFGTVEFRHFHAKAEGAEDSEGNDGEDGGDPVAITMQKGTVVRATPSELDGNHFSVDWNHA
jgi:hypothetical protein